MITSIPADKCVHIDGLSSDKKPMKFANGSMFIEMDTNATFFFDVENKKWHNYKGGLLDMRTSINEHVYQFVGLSTDTKPTDKYIGNGSRFLEMDTSKFYMYDAEHKNWISFTAPNGGGSGTIPDEDITVNIDTPEYTNESNNSNAVNNNISVSLDGNYGFNTNEDGDMI